MNSEAEKGPVILEVLNPRGVLQSDPVTGLSNPRVKDLDGKRIALMSEKPESVYFFNALEELLRERYPRATVLRMDSPANPARSDNVAEIVERCDVWLQGVKTSGSSVVDYDIKMEKLGKPGAPFCIDTLLNQRKRMAEVNGMPTLRIITIPSEAFQGAEGHPEKMKPVAASVFDATVKALTDPLTEEEKNPKPAVFDYGPIKFQGNSLFEATEKFQQYFVENYMGDGLSLTPPTREAVHWMLTGTSRSPEEEIGVMSPRYGMATIEKIAVNAVLAGARPEYLPVIITAVECLTEKCFNLYHLSTSTGSPTPLIWVNGPIAEEIGMNSKMGYLGRGCRANNTIGRAIGLCMINIGWRLMDADSGFTGDPEGFCGFTFAENERNSPWESFAVERGFKPEDSTVTINETMRYDRLGPGGGMSSQTPEQSLDILARMILNIGDPISMLFFTRCSRYQIALYPTFAKQLAEAGFTKQSLAQWLKENSCLIWDDLNDGQKNAVKGIVATGVVPGLKPEDCKSGLVIPLFNDIQHLAILVAGDMAGNTVLWSSPVGSTAMQGDSPPDCEDIPFMTKIIRGATLTKAGR